MSEAPDESVRLIERDGPIDGSVDWYYDDLPGRAFAAALHDLRSQGAVVPVRALAGKLPVFYIVSHRALGAAFRDAERFPPGHAYQIISQPYIGETFMSMDEQPHRVWRPPMTPLFRRSVIDRLEESDLVPIAHDLIDRFEPAGEADLVPNFSHRFAFAILCRQLGLPREHEALFYRWSIDLMFGGRDLANLAKSRAADTAFTAFVEPVIEARRRQPKDDVISSWLATEVEGAPIGAEAILSHVRLFFTAGATTTSDALGNLIHALLSHRDAWDRCVEENARCDDAVQELLRWNPPVAAQPRFSHPEHEVEFEGVRIPRNSAVLFGIAAANRDPESFEAPDRFDIDRRPTDLLTFGPGLRTCPGMHLAQKNLRVALSVLVQRLPRLRLVDADRDAPRGILLRGPTRLAARWA
jgi:cytochrome P450